MELRKIKISNFKCFENLKIDNGKITLLTGANSSGKSSVLHSFLGSVQSGEFPFQYSPNGKYVRMGAYKDIVRNRETSEKIEFEFEINSEYGIANILTKWEEDKKTKLPRLARLSYRAEDVRFSIEKVRKYHLSFTYNAKKDPYSLISSIPLVESLMLQLDKNIQLSKGKKGGRTKPSQKSLEDDITRFNAVRSKIEFPIDDLTNLKDEINEKGNLALQLTYNRIRELFEKFERRLNYISSFRLFPERTYYERSQKQLKVGRFGETFEDQIILWQTNQDPKFEELTSIMRSLGLLEEIKAKRIEGGRFELLVKIKSQGTVASLNDVGFGISQFLPIVVADLQLGYGSTLFIAQPEIHLHPAIQAQFGSYLVDQVKNNGKKYVLETHSEYLINRLRLAIVKDELAQEDISTYFLENKGTQSKKHILHFTSGGQIKGAPKGFFDTYMMDVMDIALNA